MARTKNPSLSWLWLDRVNPPLDEIDAVMTKYDFHELDRDAILESNQYARLDAYDDYIFLVLHFPKYDPSSERYIQNELNIFVSHEYLISFRYYQSSTMRRVYDRYETDIKNGIKESPALILYSIIEAYLDKTMKMLERFARDLKALERELFSARGTDTIRNIMTKKRNIITLKHMMKPQILVLRMIESQMKNRFSGEVELYFENLEDKMNKIFSEIELLQENIDSMEDTLKSIFELESNTTIKYLTTFSAFMLPLTLLTGFFGMNVINVPFSEWVVYGSIGITLILLILLTFFLQKKKII
jgi:magnesium transporter